MQTRALGTSLVIVLTALAFGVACQGESPRESADAEANLVSEEVKELGDAARTGAAADAARAIGQAGRDTADQIRQGGALAAAESGVKDVAEKLEKNVENAAKVAEESYDSARKKGEGRLEAAGEAYNAVLDVPEAEK